MPLKDKDARKEYMREYRANRMTREQKEKARIRKDKRLQSHYRWFREYKSSLKCEECPENMSCCLDFHHASGVKEFLVSRMINNGYSKERILKEIDKCRVLCSNCHRKLHNSI